MTFWDWLSGQQGQAVLDAVVLLVSALAAWFSAQARVTARRNQEHLEKLQNGSERTNDP